MASGRHRIPPWKYRASPGEPVVTVISAEDSLIKGNINAEGERLCHTPSSLWYERTRVSEANGDSRIGANRSAHLSSAVKMLMRAGIRMPSGLQNCRNAAAISSTMAA
jgi:hypothetical protein